MPLQTVGSQSRSGEKFSTEGPKERCHSFNRFALRMGAILPNQARAHRCRLCCRRHAGHRCTPDGTMVVGAASPALCHREPGGTPRCASRLTASWSPSGRRFPPQDLVPPGCSKNLPFPPVADPAAPPLRSERHMPNSIATMRRRLIIALAKHLGRCPCCQRAMPARSQRRTL
jgi:hypothetical protein